MPYSIVKRSGSKPYVVIKSATGERMGSHPSREAARKQLAALYANEGGKSATRKKK